MGISTNLQLQWTWAKRWTDEILRSKVKGQGHSKTTYGQMSTGRHSLTCVWNAWTYFNELVTVFYTKLTTFLRFKDEGQVMPNIFWECVFLSVAYWSVARHLRPSRFLLHISAFFLVVVSSVVSYQWNTLVDGISRSCQCLKDVCKAGFLCAGGGNCRWSYLLRRQRPTECQFIVTWRVHRDVVWSFRSTRRVKCSSVFTLSWPSETLYVIRLLAVL